MLTFIFLFFMSAAITLLVIIAADEVRCQTRKLEHEPVLERPLALDERPLDDIVPALTDVRRDLEAA